MKHSIISENEQTVNRTISDKKRRRIKKNPSNPVFVMDDLKDQ
jgi:hypothetical protein